MPTGPWPNSSPENKLPPNSDGLSRNSASSRSPPTHPKPRAASNAPGALARTVWSANFASPAPPPCRKPTPCSTASAPTTTSALPVPAAEATRDFRSLPRRFDLARCLSLHYQRVVAADHTVSLGAHSIALPPLPGHRGYAGETVELSHQLDGTLRVYRGDCSAARPAAAAARIRRSPPGSPHHGAETKNPRCPASTTSPAAPL